MRARMAILLSKQPVMLRAVVLKNKPTEMLQASAKGTVPILVINPETIIDESLDIMIWALSKSDPNNLLYSEDKNILPEMLALIARYDDGFKSCLEKYKSAKRYHEDSKEQYRDECEIFIAELDQCLKTNQYIMGDNPSLVDYAILPFIRQFARVESKWYRQTPYPSVQQWLKTQLQSKVFSKTMKKYPLWLENQESFLLGVD
jgi:glutathione S-transferase